MSGFDAKAVLNRLVAGEDLDAAATETVIGALMDGVVDPIVTSALLVALRAKGETAVEVASAARAMRRRAVRVPIADPSVAVDTCGTGGDGADTINISTAAAVVIAAAGVPVAKHGNRSVSSKCGSADVLEAAGVALELPPDALGRLVDDVGIGFLFAPRLHPAMRHVMPVRRTLRVRTVFNLLGPLTNPAGVTRQVVGVWGPDVQELLAGALAALGADHALVVHSDDGLDELSVLAPTRVMEVRDGELVRDDRLNPANLGIQARDPESLNGGDVEHNARRLREVLSGRENSAAVDAVALNAGAALVVAGRAETVADGLGLAREVLASGAALERLDALAAASQDASRG
jgi:anthranilate phosphoribosyltransferase